MDRSRQLHSLAGRCTLVLEKTLLRCVQPAGVQVMSEDNPHPTLLPTAPPCSQGRDPTGGATLRWCQVEGKEEKCPENRWASLQSCCFAYV